MSRWFGLLFCLVALAACKRDLCIEGHVETKTDIATIYSVQGEDTIRSWATYKVDHYVPLHQETYICDHWVEVEQ